MTSPYPPRKKWGQHFLANAAVADRIIEAAGIQSGESVVEIGPGDGALTRRLAARAAHLLAIEIDPLRAGALEREFSGRAEVSIALGNALSSPIGSWLTQFHVPPPAVFVGNLPYNLATAILTSAVGEWQVLSRLIATVQKEVARRIIARPGDEEYGYLSVRLALDCRAEILFELAPGAFRPRPKVTSAVIRLSPIESRLQAPERIRVLKIVSAAFEQRRKTLANALSKLGERSAWVAALERIGRGARVRAEELSPSEFIALALAEPARE